MNKNPNKKNEKNEENNIDNIEVVIGDDSILNISEVNDCMNNLRPKDSVSKRKKFIIPLSKKKEKKDDKKENE